MFQTTEIGVDDNQSIDQFWSTVGSYVGADGSSCFRELETLAKQCLCVSHRTSIPVRGFTINKRKLELRI